LLPLLAAYKMLEWDLIRLMLYSLET